MEKGKPACLTCELLRSNQKLVAGQLERVAAELIRFRDRQAYLKLSPRDQVMIANALNRITFIADLLNH